MSFRRASTALLATALAAPLLAGAIAAQAGEPASPPARVSPALEAALAAAAPGDVLRVMVNGVALGDALAAVDAHGLELLTTLDSVGVAVAAGTAEQVLATVTARDIETLEWADQPLVLDQSTSHTATRAAQAAATFTNPATDLPYDGSGVGIAIVDTGIDGNHPMFLDADGNSKVKRNLEALPLTLDSPADVVDDVDGDNNTDDVGGHGTHVASIAAGYEVVTGRGNTIVGAAPGADLYGLSTSTSASTLYGLAAATEWVVDHHAEPCGPNRPDCAPIKVVNNSWGGNEGEEFDPDAIHVQLQRALVDDGVVVVRSSGNSGGDGSSSTVTGGYKIDPRPGVITVANYDDGGTANRNGVINTSSSRGAKTEPNTWPDISAPGTEIDGACRAHHVDCSFLFSTVETDPEYGELTGTSMAAPHIAGYVALLLEADPTLTPRDVEYVLEDTAHRFPVDGGYTLIPKDFEDDDSLRSLSHYAAGHGLVDVTAALAAVLDDTNPGFPDPCAGDAVVEDPAGDAAVLAAVTDPAIGEGMPTPEVDIVAITATDVGTRIRFAIEVVDLGDVPLGNGDAVRSFFSIGGVEFTLDMNRQATNGFVARGSLSRPDPADPTGVQNIVVDNTFPVVFDPAADVAYADLDATILGDGTPVESGALMTGLSSLWRRSGGAVALPADEAVATCPLLIG